MTRESSITNTRVFSAELLLVCIAIAFLFSGRPHPGAAECGVDTPFPVDLYPG
jgi:hypothetical protein